MRYFCILYASKSILDDHKAKSVLAQLRENNLNEIRASQCLVSYPAGHVLRTERPSGTFSPFSWHELNKSHVTGNAKLFVVNADRAHACTIIALAICKISSNCRVFVSSNRRVYYS